jgi:hypothetical protein
VVGPALLAVVGPALLAVDAPPLAVDAPPLAVVPPLAGTLAAGLAAAGFLTSCAVAMPAGMKTTAKIAAKQRGGKDLWTSDAFMDCSFSVLPFFDFTTYDDTIGRR